MLLKRGCAMGSPISPVLADLVMEVIEETAIITALYPPKSHSKHTYIGLCDTSFKLRYRNHTCSFRNERYRNSTELSKYVWSLKDKKVDYQISWRIVGHARSYSNVTKKCYLCLWEKYYIICRPNMATLNNRNELVSSCRHAKKFLLNSVII